MNCISTQPSVGGCRATHASGGMAGGPGVTRDRLSERELPCGRNGVGGEGASRPSVTTWLMRPSTMSGVGAAMPPGGPDPIVRTGEVRSWEDSQI